MLVPLGVLPAATYLLVAYAIQPARPAIAPVRLALIRAAVIVAGAAVVLVELLSAGHALSRGPLLASWCAGLCAAAVAAGWRYRRAPGPRVWRPGDLWRDATWVDRVMTVGLVGLVLAELVLALGSPPNNYDSQTYHLPKIEHWVVQHDVAFFPTGIHRQLSIAPGAEYLLLQLRLLTGGDVLYNLLQWAAAAACVVLASRITAQLGGARRAQLLAGFVVGTTPMVALEATSTQTDLVVAAWVGCVATLVLDQLHRRARWTDVALLGAAVGLTGLTKTDGLFAAGPLLLVWLGAQVRLARGALPRRLPVTALAALGVATISLIIAGPYLHRVQDAYGSPLGPPYLRESIGMQRHDPAAVLVNALRIGETAGETSSARLNHMVTRAVIRVAQLVHVNPNDPKITFPHTTFPAASWRPDEDHASFPVEALLVLVGAVVVTVRSRRTGVAALGPLRAYAGVFWVTLLLFVTMVKWQPWGNRLIMFVLVVGAPLAGLWLDAVFARAAVAWQGWQRDAVPTSEAWRPPQAPQPRLGVASWRRAGAATLAAALLVLSGCVGWVAVWYGWPRRLVGHDSVFAETRMQARFNRRPEWQASFEAAAAAVRASGARRIGLVQGNDSWEYPWWLLLRGDNIVALQSLVAKIPAPAPDSVDAILCNAPTNVCRHYLPRNWHLHMEPHGIGYALPPGRDPTSHSG